MLVALQKNHPKQLQVIEAAIDAYQPNNKFDVIICCMVVHFVKDHDSGIRAVRTLQSWTKPHGINLLTGYINNQPLSEDYSFLFKPTELLSLYDSWNVHWQQESYRLHISRIHSFMDIPRLLFQKRGFKAARIIAQK